MQKVHRVTISALTGIEIVLFVLALVLPLLLENFWVLFITKIFILALLAISFDLVWGYAGIMSFGQALFFGVSGYVVALLSQKTGVHSIFVLLPIAAIVGLLLGFMMAALVILGKRIPSLAFVALGTMTGSYVIERLARGWSYVGGQNGISSLARLTAGEFEIEEGIVFCYMALSLLVIIYLLSRWLVRSQFGLVLAGIRQHENRVSFLGYNVQTFKAVIFSLSGMIAGISGALFAFHEGFIGPGQLGPVLSTQAVLYVLFGGVGTLVGAIIGVTVLDLMNFLLPQVEFLGPTLTNFLETGWPILLGLLLLCTVMFRPAGLMGFFMRDRSRNLLFGNKDKMNQSSENGLESRP